MNRTHRRTTRRSFCARSSALSATLAGVGPFTPFHLDPAVRWRRSAPETAGLFPTATDGEFVYAATENAAVAIALADGTERWRFEGVRPAILPMGTGKEHVYAVTLGRSGFTAIDRVTGAERWRSAVSGLPHVDEGTVFAADDALYAFSARDGTVDWMVDLPGGVTGIAPTRTTAFVGGVGRVHAVRRRNGREHWRFEVPDASERRYLYPVHADAETSRLLVWDYRKRVLRSFDAVDGRERWRYEVDNSMSVFRGVVTERVAVVVEGFDVVAVSLVDGTERWRFSAGEELALEPQILHDENAVVARSQHRAYCVSLDDGTVEWTFDTEGEIDEVEADEDVTLTTRKRESELRRVVRLSGNDGSFQWGVEMRREYLQSLTSGGRVFVGTETGLELLTTPSGLVGRFERLVAGNPSTLFVGGAGIAAVAVAMHRYLSGYSSYIKNEYLYNKM